MSLIRRKKTKPQQATDWLTTVLELGAVGAAARGAATATKKGAKKAGKKAAARGGKGVLKRVAPVAAIAAVGVIAAKKLRGGGGEEPAPAWEATTNGSPTPATAPVEPAGAPTPPAAG